MSAVGTAAPPDRPVARADRPAPDDRGLERAMLAAAALVGFVAAAGVMADNSLLTHIATGRWILDHGSVPDADPYSRFGAGQPWTVQSWLVSLVYAVLDRGFGPAAIRVLHGVLGALIGAGTWRLTAPAVQIGTRTVLTMVPLVIGVGLWSPRPLLVGLAALVGLLVLHRSTTPRLWPAVPLLWVWANAHGSFPLGVGLVALAVLGWRLDRGTWVGRPLRLLGWSVLGVLLAPIGPLGLRVLTFPLGVVLRRGAMDGVVEWQPPTFSSSAELLWLGLAVVPVLAARRGARLADLLPSVVMVVAAALALRNVAPASLAVVAFAAPALAPTAPAGVDRRFPPLAGRAIGLSAVAALVVGVVSVVLGPGLELDRYPTAEIDRLEAARLVPFDEVVLVHREAVGNYLTWRYGDRADTFIDDRFDFHALDLLADHRDLLAGRDPRPVLDRWGADVVLWEADGALTAWLAEAPEWVVDPPADDQEWVVACRRSSPAFDRCRQAAQAG